MKKAARLSATCLFSGWADLNRRPHVPQTCTLNHCATARSIICEIKSSIMLYTCQRPREGRDLWGGDIPLPPAPPILKTAQQACIQALYPDAESHRFYVTI